MSDQFISKESIAGVVVLYNSHSNVLKNIDTYINQIAVLYVVDNSPIINEILKKNFIANKKIIYCHLGGNMGIASALNWAANRAIENGFSFLLTMDDDTSIPTDMIEKMVSFWNQNCGLIGILSGVHHETPDEVIYRKVMYTLTSGNILSLAAYKKVGSFRSDFFIDHVDHEYGLRLNKSGYCVIEVPSIRLKHKLGRRKQVNVGSFEVIKYGTHDPVRQYYFARNGFYLSVKYIDFYPKFFFTYIAEMMKRVFKALFLDEKKLSRIIMIVNGIHDGIIGHLGKHPDSI